jgi:hypothetical protein
MSPEEKAELIVKDIIKDLKDRRGLRQEWDQFDNGIKQEITATWRSIALEALRRSE